MISKFPPDSYTDNIRPEKEKEKETEKEKDCVVGFVWSLAFLWTVVWLSRTLLYLTLSVSTYGCVPMPKCLYVLLCLSVFTYDCLHVLLCTYSFVSVYTIVCLGLSGCG